jgi:hypothetical protein
VRDFNYHKDGGTIVLFFEDGCGQHHSLRLPRQLRVDEETRDLFFDTTAVPRRSALEAALMRGLRRAQFDLRIPQIRGLTLEESCAFARQCAEQIVSWVASEEYLAWPAVRQEHLRAKAEQARTASAGPARELAARRRAAAIQGGYTDGDRCPKCEFRYGWDGSACGHCGEKGTQPPA